MANPLVNPVALIKLAQADEVKATVAAAAMPAQSIQTPSIFDQMLGRAVDSLNSVSELEMNTNKLIDQYVQGKAELSDVMMATAKMTIAVNLAVSTITTAVSSFKEITQMAI